MSLSIWREKTLSEMNEAFIGMDDFTPLQMQFTIFIMHEYRKYSRYPSYRTFMTWFNMTYYEVQKHMKDLQREGVIEIHARSGYVLTPEWLIRALTREVKEADKYIEKEKAKLEN